MPPAAPSSIAGNVGPPRNVPTDRPYARPLKASRSARAESDQSPGLATIELMEFSPENSTSLTLLSAACEKAIARPATATPASGMTRNGRGTARRCVHGAIRKITKVPTATATARTIVQPKSASSGRSNGGSFRAEIEISLVLSPVQEPIPIQKPKTTATRAEKKEAQQ